MTVVVRYPVWKLGYRRKDLPEEIEEWLDQNTDCIYQDNLKQFGYHVFTFFDESEASLFKLKFDKLLK
jgi:hypothetical protein